MRRLLVRLNCWTMRSDVNLFLPAVEFLENKTKKPVLGIIPHIENLGIDDEDSVSLDDKISKNAEIKIAVVRLQKLSNFTDFDSLAGEVDVNLFYAKNPAELDDADLIILPGSKNTSEDLIYLRESHFAEKILQLAENVPVIGICGGFQMLGEKLFDPQQTESKFTELEGLKLLPISTTFTADKFTSQVTIPAVQFNFLGSEISAENLAGYEIHSGRWIDEKMDRWIVSAENVFGTYVHGIFDNDNFRRQILNALRRKKNLPALEVTKNFRADKQKNYERLAKIVRENLNMSMIEKIIF